MTDNKNFKKLVRDRMAKTGESYTTARNSLVAHNVNGLAVLQNLQETNDTPAATLERYLMSSEADQRWWFVPGEIVTTLREADKSIPLAYEYDDGNVWGFRLGEERVLWDHQASALVLGATGLEAATAQRLRETIKTLALPRPRWVLTRQEQATIDRVAFELHESRWITGRKLRHALKMSGNEFAKIKETLRPRYLVDQSGDKGDYYQLTLSGLLLSSERAFASRVIECALLVLREKFEADPDTARFGTEDLISRGKFDPEDGGVIDGVLNAAWLTHGGGGQGEGRTLRMTYGVPPDIEDLIKCTSTDDFVRLVRQSGHNQRAWPTAPMKLAMAVERGHAHAATASAQESPMRYDVTLSFAGEDRQHAEALADLLRVAGVKVFYDRYEQAELWGKNLYEHLHSVYSEQATFCVIFVSEHYAKKLWTSHERKAAQERAFKERGGEYILPIRLDETRLPGLADTIGHLSINDGIDQIAAMLIKKLRARGDLPGETTASSTTASEATKTERHVTGNSQWLAPVATLTSRGRATPVPAVSWLVSLEQTTPFDGTKAELHDALNAAVVTYDLGNFGRGVRWPRLLVLPDAKQETRGDGTLVWSYAYATGAANEVGDEQLSLTPTGAFTFQRDVVWDTDDPAVDFGLLADDVLLCLLFAERFSSAIGLSFEGGRATLSLRRPESSRGTLAIFHATPVSPEQPHRAARLPNGRGDPAGSIRLPVGPLGADGLVAAAKRLLDRVANEFDHDASVLGSGPNFMAISTASLAARVKALKLAPPVEPEVNRGPALTVRFERTSMDRDSAGTVVVHHYELVARLTNTTSKRLDDWYVEAELPTLLLEPDTAYKALVTERSDLNRSLLRTSTKLPPLPSGDHYEWRLPYRVDNNIFWNHHEALERAAATTRAFVDGALVAEIVLEKIQDF
jgi:hypothetical protein